MDKVNYRQLVLMADDDEDFQYLFKDAFEEAKLPNAFEYVENGEELLNRLLGRGRFARTDAATPLLPALILLDLNMPKMSGHEALKEIRAHEDLKHLPIIILTISDSHEDILKSYRLGANSFVTKPFSQVHMREFIKKISEYWLSYVKIPQTR